MRNTLLDLNNHLFEQLERLNDSELTGDELVSEIKRAKAMSSLATQIINNGHLTLKAIKMEQEYFGEQKEIPKNLLGNK